MIADRPFALCLLHIVSGLSERFCLSARKVLDHDGGTRRSASLREMGNAALGLGCVVLAAWFGPATELHASLVVYEGFAYPNGNLEGKSGGFGAWEAAWQTVEGRATAVSNGAASLQMLNNVDSGTIRRMFTSNLGTAGSTTWIRWSGQYSTTGPTLSASGGLSFINEDYTEQFRIGKFSDSNVWSVGHATTVSNSTVALTDSADLWVRIQHTAGNDAIRFWVNPLDKSSESALDSGTFYDLAGLDLVGIRGLRLAAAAGTNSLGVPIQTWTFDDLRVGSSFGAMSAVPEPSSGLLVAGAAVVMLVRRRRG